MMQAIDQKQRGFNVIELLVVMSIIVIITVALTLPGIWGAYDKAKEVVSGRQGDGITGEYYSGSSQNGGIFNTLITSRTDDTIKMMEADRPTGNCTDNWQRFADTRANRKLIVKRLPHQVCTANDGDFRSGRA